MRRTSRWRGIALTPARSRRPRLGSEGASRARSTVAAFTAGDEELVVEAGHVVVVAARTPHGFEGAGEDAARRERHPSGTVEQTDL
ncbi:MAG: hypothetical protein M3N47_07680 [Chloroflexota bacterium]|nr:hypothetical protein [Chloroflexota bacterium]